MLRTALKARAGSSGEHIARRVAAERDSRGRVPLVVFYVRVSGTLPQRGSLCSPNWVFRRDAGNGARGNHVDPQCLAAVKLMIAIASGYLLLFDTAEMKISARNILRGRVKRVVEGAVNCELTLEIAPGIEIVSIITKASVESLGLVEARRSR